jgi:signal transduction histidine kinase
MTDARDYGLQRAVNALLELSLEELSLEELLRRSLDLILALPWLALESKGSISLVRGAPEALVMMASRGLPEELLRLCAAVPFGTCHCGRAAATREIQFSAGVDERHDIRYAGITPHGHYCVPILFRGRVLGVVNLYLKEGHRSTPAEIAFLTAIANTLAGVVQRSTIEEERERLIGELQDAVTVIGLSQQEWQETFDGITDLVAVVAPDGALLKVNKAFAAHCRRHPRELVDAPRRFSRFAGEGPFSVALARALEEKRPRTEELEDPGTGRLFRVTTFPCIGPGRAVTRVIHVARDVTDEREQERRLVASEQFAALGRMASGIAHEINTPLASIAGCAEGLLARIDKGGLDLDLCRRYLAIVQEEVSRCRRITTSMLSCVRQATAERREVDLNAVLDRALEVIGFQGRLQAVEVVRRCAAGLPPVLVNEEELRQVVLTVIIDALDATQDRGRLEVETRADAGSVSIAVTHPGAGRPAGEPEEVDPLSAARSAQPSAGLGLAIARRILAEHGGSITSSSPAGVSTTVTITLPLPAAG